MHVESPQAFLLLLAVPLLLWLQRRGRGGAVRFSSTRNAARAGASLRQRLGFLPLLLRVAALVLLVVALARPQRGLQRVRDINRGIAIEMVVDRSGSMAAEMEYDGRKMTRLDVVKRVFRDFVLGSDRLRGRPNDLIGMVAFARYADTVCPLTLAHGALDPFLDSVQLVQRREEDGTSIGDALALAAARLQKAEETLREQVREEGRKAYEIKSRVIILLTDGENNAGKRTPLQAAELAADWDIKIYTIGIGGGDAVATIQTPFGAYKVPTRSRIDEGTLKAVAEATGGIYRRADSAQALEDVYDEIDELERSEIESIRFMDYEERFTGWALAALLVLVAETALRCFVFRRIP